MRRYEESLRTVDSETFRGLDMRRAVLDGRKVPLRSNFPRKLSIHGPTVNVPPPGASRMRPSRHALVSAAGAIVATIVAAPPLDAGEILVPGNFATIGEAIAASTAGDTILVGPGVYAESIVFSEGAGDGVVLR